MAEDHELSGLDRPRPMPEGLRARLEATLLAEGEALAAGIPRSVDGPRPLPPGLRSRLEGTLLDRRTPVRSRAPVRSRGLVAVAAAVVLLLGLASLTVLPRTGGRSDTDVAAGRPEGRRSTSTTASPTAADVAAGAPGAAPTAAEAQVAPQRRAAAGAGATAASGSSGGSGTPPPFSFAGPARGRAEAAPAAAQGGSGAGAESDSASRSSRSGSPATGLPLPIAYLGGDAAQVAGLRAYLDLLNRTGGVKGRPVRAEPTDRQSADALVAVNLGAVALPAPGPRPLLETLAAPDAALRGDVFSFASAVDRQAHLIADEVFPSAAPGATATIYTQRSGGGAFTDAVPAALESVLRARGVATVRMPYAGGQVARVRSDAVFLSLDGAAVREWLAGGGVDAVTTTRGIAGVFSLVDEGIAGRFPDGTRAIAPYRYPTGEEAAELRRATSRPLDSSLVHGWSTAKALAVALWQSGADSRAEMPAALRGLAGYDSGMAPPYEVRPGTTSRTPEGVLWITDQQVQTPSGGFRRDPH